MSDEKKKPTTKAYGGRKHGKYTYGNGGLNDLWAGFVGIPDEKWDAIDWSDYPEEGRKSASK